MSGSFAAIAPQVAKLLRLLASPDEVIATVAALQRVLASAHLDLNDLGSVIEFAARREAPPIASTIADDLDVREMVQRCYERADLLTSRELAFVCSIARWHGEPTLRQRAWLCALHERCVRAEAPDA